MQNRDDLLKLKRAYERRLQKLKELEALQGYAADPKIAIEIEDIQAKIAELENTLDTLAASQPAGGPGPQRASADQAALFEMPEQLIGGEVSAYRLGDFVGSGGTGLVFAAAHRSLGRKVAVKLFYPLAPNQTSVYQFLERGFRALGALEHPNIVRVIDSGLTKLAGPESFYLVMEYVQGIDLASWSKGLGSEGSQLRRRLDAAVQLARALQAAHNTIYIDNLGFEVRGVLHGDLKPSNVLVTQAGQVKLLDFLLIDIQRLLDPETVPDSVETKTSIRPPLATPITELVGTPGFMAPEQKGHGVISTKSDIYGLGVTLGHLFAPDAGDHLIMRLLTRNLPEKLAPFILAEMMADDPAHRPDMDTVVARLEAARAAA